MFVSLLLDMRVKTHLRISDEHNLCAGAARSKAVDGRGDSGSALSRRITVRNASAGRLTTACRVDDGLGGGARVGTQNQVDNRGSCAVSSWGRGLAGSKHVDGRAALACGKHGRFSSVGINGGAADEERVRPQEEESRFGRGPHVDGSYWLGMGDCGFGLVVVWRLRDELGRRQEVVTG